VTPRVLLLILLAAGVPVRAGLAQTAVVLEEMSGERGLVVAGKGGLTTGGEPLAGALGRSVAFVDLDGDGLDDLVAGAPLLPQVPLAGVQDDAGRAYVLFGSEDAGAPGSDPAASFASLDPGEGLELRGLAGHQVGHDVANAGDLDGDGFDDLLVGAPFRTIGTRTSAGGAYVVWGAADVDTLPVLLNLDALAADPQDRATFFQGARAFGSAGIAVSAAGDMNADGIDDVAIGAPFDSTNGMTNNGTATIVYGSPAWRTQTTVDLATLGPGEITEVHGDASFQLLGQAVAGIGRFDPILPLSGVDQDPLLGDDLAIGAPGSSPDGKIFAGAVYVLRGTNGPVPPTSYDASQFGDGPDTAGIVYTGGAAGDAAGTEVAPARDFITDFVDTYQDLIITAPSSDGAGKTNSGSTYVVPGVVFGILPQGFDLGKVGLGDPEVLGVHIGGEFANDGAAGLTACNAGDWNDDGFDDLAIGTPSSPHVDGQDVFLQAGRLRVVDGLLALLEQLTIDLGDTTEGFILFEADGETGGALAGSSVACGDFNGDGFVDAAVGAEGAPSEAAPGAELALSESGRAHVVYGPVARFLGLAPTTSHLGGPEVTITAANVVDDAGVTVDGVPATVTEVVTGDVGTVTFAPPAPLVPGNLADVRLSMSTGAVEVEDALQYTLFSVTSGPSPASGQAGTQVSFTGEAFSTVADTQVDVDGFPATVLDVDGLAGTMTIELPSGPALGSTVDVDIATSNGSQTLVDALTYADFLIASVTPDSASQMAGIFDEMLDMQGMFAGFPPVDVDVEMVLSSGVLPPDLVIEFGDETVGFREGEIDSTAGLVATVTVPDFLLGPSDVAVDVRASSEATGDVDVFDDAFTYLASDFVDRGLGTAGSAGVPEFKMAGAATNGGDIMIFNANWPPVPLTSTTFFGLAFADPPTIVKGGEFGIDPSLGLFSFSIPFPFPVPGGTFAQSFVMPQNLAPSADGVSLFFQVVNAEEAPGSPFAFSNVVEMILDVQTQTP